MQISFWSNYERSGVSSNIAAIGVMLSHIYPCRIVLMEDHVSNKSLDKILIGNRFENYNYAGNFSMVAETIGSFYGTSDKKSLKRDVYFRETGGRRISILEDNLSYISHDPVVDQQGGDFDMYVRLTKAMSEASRNGEMLLIDAHSGFGLTSKIVLDASDLIVVNLRQDEGVIEDFLKNYSSITYKCVFLLGSYKSIPWLHKREIAMKYGLDEKKIAVIPYNSDFEMAVLKGRVADFIIDNYKCRQQSPDYGFIHDLKYATNLIMHNILITQRYKGGMANYI